MIFYYDCKHKSRIEFEIYDLKMKGSFLGLKFLKIHSINFGINFYPDAKNNYEGPDRKSWQYFKPRSEKTFHQVVIKWHIYN